MTRRIVYSPRGQRDLEKIRDWIEGESRKPREAHEPEGFKDR